MPVGSGQGGPRRASLARRSNSDGGSFRHPSPLRRDSHVQPTEHRETERANRARRRSAETDSLVRPSRFRVRPRSAELLSAWTRSTSATAARSFSRGAARSRATFGGPSLRSQAAGHGASEREIRAIHRASVANLGMAVAAFDRVRVYYSAARWAPPRLVAVARGGHLVRQGSTPGWLEGCARGEHSVEGMSPFPKCLHDWGRFAWTDVDSWGRDRSEKAERNRTLESERRATSPSWKLSHSRVRFSSAPQLLAKDSRR
jgi:hypothetical protein